MKKNTNILEYVEKYKYKYGISYLGENVKLVKTITVFNAVAVLYTLFWLVITILGTLIELKHGDIFIGSGRNAFISITFCAAIMLIILVLYCVKQNFVLKMVENISLIVTQFISIISLWHVTKDVTGLHHIAAFYWCHLIPSLMVTVLSVVIMCLLLSAKIKNNKLYNTIVEGLYKQFGSKDGEKLSENEWEDFLTKYNPYKNITQD